MTSVDVANNSKPSSCSFEVEIVSSAAMHILCPENQMGSLKPEIVIVRFVICWLLF